MKRFFVFPLVVFALLGSATAALAWERPVRAPVVEQWDPPPHDYAAGNRGVDFAAVDRVEVRAAGEGTISFAGNVGGTVYVVIEHADDLRTTYGNLAQIDVTSGQQVRAGDVLGRASGRVHFGLRNVDGYLDPNVLFGGPSLVPLE